MPTPHSPHLGAIGPAAAPHSPVHGPAAGGGGGGGGLQHWQPPVPPQHDGGMYGIDPQQQQQLTAQEWGMGVRQPVRIEAPPEQGKASEAEQQQQTPSSQTNNKPDSPGSGGEVSPAAGTKKSELPTTKSSGSNDGKKSETPAPAAPPPPTTKKQGGGGGEDVTASDLSTGVTYAGNRSATPPAEKVSDSRSTSMPPSFSLPDPVQPSSESGGPPAPAVRVLPPGLNAQGGGGMGMSLNARRK